MMNRVVTNIKKIKDDKLTRSMFLNTLCKPASMLITFFYTPVLLNYLGEESYGIWSTILSVINWINYFDVGIGNGLRNMLAKHIDKGEKDEASHAVSTGYVALSMISGLVFLIGSILILLVDVNLIFNSNINIRPVLLVSFACICLNFILALSKVQLYATHQAEKVGFMTVMMQGINLFGVLLLSLFSEGNMLAVAIVIGCSGIFVNAWFSKGVWKRHKYLIPSLKKYQPEKLKEICDIGVKFFIVQMAALVLYSTDNMIITQLFGPAYVTPYHTSYTAFGLVNGLFGAMLAPLWSKYTVALQNNDYTWIKNTIFSLNKTLPLIGLILVMGVVVFKPLSVIWLQKNLEYEPGLILGMAIYYFLVVWGHIYATALNGMGRIDLQMYFGVGTAILNIPLSIVLGKYVGLGTTGVLLATIICMLITNIFVIIDTHKFINKQEKLQFEKNE